MKADRRRQVLVFTTAPHHMASPSARWRPSTPRVHAARTYGAADFIDDCAWLVIESRHGDDGKERVAPAQSPGIDSRATPWLWVETTF